MNFHEIRRKLCNVISIPVTPFHTHNPSEIDWKAFASNIERQIDSGIEVLTPNGNTSEFFSLTPQETEQICKEALNIGAGRALVMPGIGYDLKTACKMAADAYQAGAKAVMVHEPVHPFMVREGWVTYHQEISNSVPEMAVVCYLRHSGIRAQEILQVAEKCPNFVGIKYAVPDVVAFAEAARILDGSELALICGVAETWAPFFWPAGAQGFTSGLVNVTPIYSIQLLKALRQGCREEAMRVWNVIRPFELLRTKDQSSLNVSVVKEAMHQMGFASRLVRPPLAPVEDHQRSIIGELLLAFGLSPSA